MSLFSPAFLLPFNLVTPYLFIAGIGFSIFEMLIIIGGVKLTLKNGIFNLQTPRIIYYFLFLFLMGSFIGALNGVKWGVPFGIYEFILILYKAILVWFAFHIGFNSRLSIQEIISTRYFYILVMILGVFACAYPFLSFEQRYAAMYFHTLPGHLESMDRYTSPRFPGMGINANIYSFMVFFFYIASLHSFLKYKTSWINPLLLFLIILVSASKTILGLSIFSLLIIILTLSVKKINLRILSVLIYKRIIIIACMLGVILIAVFIILYNTELGSQLKTFIIIFDRIMNVIYQNEVTAGQVSGLGTRLDAWSAGIERVKLAPFLGIAFHRFIQDGPMPLFYSTPHNDFIRLWMHLGLLGLIAHCSVIIMAIRVNIKNQSGIVWLLFYFTLIIQLFFDGAFAYTRYFIMWFMIFGVNLSEIQNKNKNLQGSI